jgi:hypothetical protein
MFDAFYTSYVAVCTELAVTPLTAKKLCALIVALLERSAAIIH